jgi:PadR family transcriptional regulator, regulatory protein PadR
MARTDVLPGTLDLLIIKTLETLGAQHSYAIAKRLQQISDDALQLNQGSLYPALLRLEQRGWIRSEWRTSDNNRQAKYYSLTRSGRRELAVEAAGWERMASIMARVLKGEG